MVKYYLPISWVLSYLFYYLYVTTKKRNEQIYSELVKTYSPSKYLKISEIRLILKNSDNEKAVKEFKKTLLYLNLSFITFFVPIIGFFIQVTFFTNYQDF
jgi:hypothetical protein